jgi:hypothetical protein
MNIHDIAAAFLREFERGLHVPQAPNANSEPHVALVNARGEYFARLKSSGQPVLLAPV